VAAERAATKPESLVALEGTLANTCSTMNPIESDEALPGARFYDGKRRDLGWASRVSERAASLGNLTVLDVTTTDVDLAKSLVLLDKKKLSVKSCDPSGRSYSFLWASGYGNGGRIRIQGVLER
jgi:hypothetical protein